MIDSGAYTWLTREARVGVGEAGCVTVVVGGSGSEVLQAFGAEPGLRVSVDADRDSAPPNLAGLVELADGACVVVEPNGFQGARQEVLRRASKSGVAAAVQWDVNGSVYVGCARKGRVLCLVDLVVDEDLDGMPAKLKRLRPKDRLEADLVAVGAAMVETFVGVGFGEHDVSGIDGLHVLSPVLADLPWQSPETSPLRYGARWLLESLVAADDPTRRALAEWSAIQAVRQADLAHDSRVRSITDQFDRRGPAQMTTGLMELAQVAERALALAENTDPFRRADRGPSGLRYRWARQRKAAAEALRYCCEVDDLVAVLGAVDNARGCASINRAISEFDAELRRLLPLRPAEWATDAIALPGPPTPEQRRGMLADERARVDAMLAAERPWNPTDI